MARRTGFATVLLSLLVSSSGCSAVLVSTMGTNYDDELPHGKMSRSQVHERFGPPISSTTYGTPREPGDTPATAGCSEYWTFARHDDPTPHLLVAGSEVFEVRGRVIVPEDHWIGYVFLDFITLTLAEWVTTPIIILDWLSQWAIEKELKVYYRTDDTVAGGEIRFRHPAGARHLIGLPWWEEKPNGLITLAPACMHP